MGEAYKAMVAAAEKQLASNGGKPKITEELSDKNIIHMEAMPQTPLFAVAEMGFPADLRPKEVIEQEAANKKRLANVKV